MLMDESELLYGELYYECRIVSFFDTLGWRQQIQEAGDDPRRIARLASVPRLFSSAVMEMAKRAEGAQMTAFSDAVIVSVPYDADRLLWNLQGLATVQLGLALSGFWVRGATTVGHLVHDPNIVFGPALNRAYELENQSAIYPRILIDPLIPELMKLQVDFISADDDVRFTDPFNVDFITRVQKMPLNTAMIRRFNKIAGSAILTAPVPMDSHVLLRATLLRIRAELMAASRADVWRKHAWLFDRIAPRIQHPERSADFIQPSR